LGPPFCFCFFVFVFCFLLFLPPFCFFFAAQTDSLKRWPSSTRPLVHFNAWEAPAARHLSDVCTAGLPDFFWQNIPKRRKIYYNATKLPNSHIMYQMAVMYSKSPKNITTCYIPRPSKILPKLWFLVWKYTIWQPWCTDGKSIWTWVTNGTGTPLKYLKSPTALQHLATKFFGGTEVSGCCMNFQAILYFLKFTG
jgi:hypothetical protein